MHQDKNTQLLEGIRCPECHSTLRFAIQVTMNVVLEDDGLDVMASTPADDVFAGVGNGREITEEHSGLRDDDPIQCLNYCGHLGTVAQFRLGW